MSGLYHLKDEKGWFRSIIYICGEAWVTKNLKQEEAAIYTEVEMKAAKAFFTRKKVRVFEHEIVRGPKRGPVGKTWKKNEKHDKSPQLS